MRVCLFVVCICIYFAASQCISDSNSVCNCSSVGACCTGDVNVCNQNYNLCVAQNPLIGLNKSLGCPCVQDYSLCFSKLICQPSSQANVGANCQTLTTEYITSSACPASDLSCVFAALPTLPPVNCGPQTACSGCSYSSNCKWCNQNTRGLCVDSSGTCTRVNPADTMSKIYEFSLGQCDNSVDDVLNVLLTASPPIGQQMNPYFGLDTVLNAAGVQISGLANFKTDPNTLMIRYDLTSTATVTDFQRFCDVAKNIATGLLGVTDTNRILCNPGNITGTYTVTTYITQSAAPTQFGPTPPTGGGSAIPPIGIAAIVIFAVGIILIIVAVIVFFVLRNKNSTERA